MCPVKIDFISLFKGFWYILMGGNSEEIVLPPFSKGVY